MINQRAQPRSNVCLEVVWDGTSGNYIARMTDLSQGGAYIDTIGAVVIGEILGFEIQLSRGEHLQLEGEVTHSKASVGFGVRFINLDEHQVQSIRRILESGMMPSQSCPEFSLGANQVVVDWESQTVR
jgi:hypothetical protein